MLAARTRLNEATQSKPAAQEGTANADDRVDPVQVSSLLLMSFFDFCYQSFGQIVLIHAGEMVVLM
jgi:hypothetical protein